MAINVVIEQRRAVEHDKAEGQVESRFEVLVLESVQV